MTSSIDLLGVLADVVILLALAAAVASPGMSQLIRPVIATCAFACAWLTTAVLDTLRAPGWTIFLGGAVIAVSILVLIATVHRWTYVGDSEPGLGGAQGGDGRRHRRPDAPHDGGGGGAPGW